MRNTEVNNLGRIIDAPSTSHSNEGEYVNQTGRCAQCGGATERKFCDSICYTEWRRSQPIQDRFWPKVHKTPSCWVWTGSSFGKDGYGGIYVSHHQKPEWKHPRPTLVHRLSWELAHGPIPEGRHVLHSCDNRRCVNPAHLFLGDQDANMKDAASKGRLNVPRPNHPRRKLTDSDVTDIVNLHRSGMQQQLIAARYGVTKACISQIVNGHRRVYTAPQLQQTERKGAA